MTLWLEVVPHNEKAMPFHPIVSTPKMKEVENVQQRESGRLSRKARMNAPGNRGRACLLNFVAYPFLLEPQDCEPVGAHTHRAGLKQR